MTSAFCVEGVINPVLPCGGRLVRLLASYLHCYIKILVCNNTTTHPGKWYLRGSFESLCSLCKVLTECLTIASVPAISQT